MNKNNINYLQKKIDNIHTKEIILTLKEYNLLLKLAAKMFEMETIVFLYDSIKENNLQPSSDTFYHINKLHSKTIKNNSFIRVPIKNINRLKPRRRIHKIIKGYNYTKNYNKALLHKNDVINYLHLHPEIIQFHRIKLAKNLSKKCNITFNEARYIITNLKRTKFLKIDTPKISDFSNLEKFIEEERKSRPINQQTRISDFFNKKI